MTLEPDPIVRARMRGGVVLLAVALGSTSCGTILTRTRGDVFGYSPYEAVISDGKLIAYALGFDVTFENTGTVLEGDDGWKSGLFSLPLDLVFDTVALPIDLVAWIFGGDKRTLGIAQRERSDKD